MMKQYLAIRRDLPPETFLLFRLGDFYEMFGEDAQAASPILNVALTKRGNLPMCGVPFHAAKAYIEKLVAAGYRVALCEQVGEVKAGKLVRREVTQILSPGTLDDFGLDERRPNYLAAICPKGDSYGLAVCEMTTGALQLTSLDSVNALRDELTRLQPAETLAPAGWEDQSKLDWQTSPLDDFLFDPDQARDCLINHFDVQSLDGFGCDDLPAGVDSAGALLHYVTRHLRRRADHIRTLRPYRNTSYLHLDSSTRIHLELSQSPGGRAMTLVGTLDATCTPMGARTMRGWILQPLRKVEEIAARQNCVDWFLQDPQALVNLRQHLAGIKDLERSISRLTGPSGNARDLAALADSLEQIPGVTEATLRRTPEPGALTGTPPPTPPELIAQLTEQLDPLPDLHQTLKKAVADEPPAILRDGGMIRSGFDSGLDELRAASHEGKQWIADLQEREIERTGIKSLKVKFTSVFGYFIEITKANLSAVPEEYTRKQTTANAERFITPELKTVEGKILGCEERAKAREIELFHQLRDECIDHLDAIQLTASALGAIDTLASFAETARHNNYVRPEVDSSGILEITDGRHPVIEHQSSIEGFVPNDTHLAAGERRFAIITGPNMAGKSTYIRQVALLVLMAQTGSFIPARSAQIGVCDRIFTRVGASDDIARGQSTFMVEMNETARILNNATPDSLVILDEIGRGTSTFDGLSIAWSVAEHLHGEIRCRALFATHYHEMTDLERSCPGVINLNVAVREWNDQVIFLRKIQAGRADQSYGIQVARLAGLPDKVLSRAREILANLEKTELNAEGEATFSRSRKRKKAIKKALDQLELL